MAIWNPFKSRKNAQDLEFPQLDVHSHLLPGIDDGAKNLDDSIQMIKRFSELGFKHLITTPHIIQDYYPNTPEIIKEKLIEVQQEIEKEQIPIKLEAAAEYYIDEFFLDKLKNKEELLTFGNNYLLVEMSFMSESPYIKDCIFQMKSSGITPVLAHVERYPYYYKKMETIEDLMQRGCLIQINVNSLAGHYGKPAKQAAESLIDQGFVHLLGSDCHFMGHLDLLMQVRNSKYYLKALNLPLLNFSIPEE